MKATELIVNCLENEGVDYIFGLPGEENMDLLDALLDSSIRFVMTRHEQGAAFMANVYGRLTGKAGVCLATLGPGATNLITGVADANMDRAPLVALTGQAAHDRMHKESHQHLDIVTLFRPATKWNTSLPKPDIIPEALRKAFKLAQSEKPGATHIEIPEDVARMETDGEPLLVQRPHPGGAAPDQIEKAARIISEAASPVVLAGNGVIRGQASAALVRFAEKLNIPVATTFMAKGVIPDTSPLALGAIGLQMHDYPNRRVVAVTGDGGFLMNSQELETAGRLGTPFVVLVFNDRSYGLIRWKQMQQFGRPAFVDFNNPDFVKYAESFGAKGCRIESADELAPALCAALTANKLTIIDCPVDAAENQRLTQRLATLAVPSGGRS